VRGRSTRLISREAGLVAAILACGLGIRLLGAGHGLPYLHEWDEPTVMSFVIRMLQRGDFNPAVFGYPSVYYYLLLPVAHLHYWYLQAHGHYPRRGRSSSPVLKSHSGTWTRRRSTCGGARSPV